MTVRPLKLWIGRGVDCVRKHQVLHPSMPSQKVGDDHRQEETTIDS